MGQTEEQMRGPEAGVKLTHLRRRQREGAGEGMELERLAGVVREYRSRMSLELIQRKWEVIGELEVKECDLICLNIYTIIIIIIIKYLFTINSIVNISTLFKPRNLLSLSYISNQYYFNS